MKKTWAVDFGGKDIWDEYYSDCGVFYVDKEAYDFIETLKNREGIKSIQLTIYEEIL